MPERARREQDKGTPTSSPRPVCENAPRMTRATMSRRVGPRAILKPISFVERKFFPS
jgi:hypothetical protein